MKKDIGRKIKLGLFVTLGIFIFIVAVYYIGSNKNLFSSTFRISGIFHNVSGLRTGNNVRFSGINVGTVTRIEIISDSSVRVDMIIDDDVRKFIKKDAIAIIGSEGLMGDKIVSITPGTLKMKTIEENDFIETEKPLDIDDIMINLKNTTDYTTKITKDISQMISNTNYGKGVLGRLLGDTLLANNLAQTVMYLEQSSRDLNNSINALNPVISNTGVITSNLAKISASINTSKGAIRTLLMDTAFAENLKETMVNIKQGTKGFDQSMEALKNSFLLKGYFKKKEKKKEETP